MAHTHDHNSPDYYIEQLCTIGICAALGGGAVVMYYRGTLNYILAQGQFHLWVLLGGITLLTLVAVRAVALWVAVGKPVNPHHHDHDHGHDHDHDHDHGHDHDHHHDHDCCHDHPHDHDHRQETAPTPAAPVTAATNGEPPEEDHGHAHGWSPWRYMVLLFPVVLFLLNLPNQGPQGDAARAQEHIRQLDDSAIRVIVDRGTVENLDFKALERYAYSERARKEFEGKIGRLKGQFMPGPDDRSFGLARFKITCCSADAIQLNVIILSPASVSEIKPLQWVEATGQIQFRKRRDKEDEYIPVLQLRSRDDLVPIQPEANPYLQ